MVEPCRKEVLEAVKNNGEAFEHIPAIYKDDAEIVLQAIRHYSVYYRQASQRLQKDPTIIMEAIKNGLSLKWIVKSHQTPEIILEALARDSDAIHYMSVDLIKHALKQIIDEASNKKKNEEDEPPLKKVCCREDLRRVRLARFEKKI